jgi:hypothetical protein
VTKDFEIDMPTGGRRFCVEVDDATALFVCAYDETAAYASTKTKLTNEQWLQLLAITSVHEIAEDGAYVAVSPALAPDELRAVQELARTAYWDAAEGESERRDEQRAERR